MALLPLRRARRRPRARRSRITSNQPALLHGRVDEAPEQGVRFEGTRFQLRVILDADEPGMVLVFHDLRQNPVWRHAREAQALRLQLVPVGHVDLVAVPVALGDFRAAIDLRHLAALLQRGLERAEAHGAAEIAACRALLQFVAAQPLGEKAHHRLGGRAEFGGAGVLDSGERPGRLHHRHLHAEADAEIRHLALAGELRRPDLALGAALAESACSKISLSIHSRFTFTWLAMPPWCNASISDL